MAASGKRGQPYTVGWGKPPAASRFQPGRSGNPNGRPKASADMTGQMKAVLTSKISVSEPEGKSRSITIQEALVRKVRQMALEGDLGMQKIVLRLTELAEQIPAPIDPYKAELDEWEQAEMVDGLSKMIAEFGDAN
jgi:hypothetical protein